MQADGMIGEGLTLTQATKDGQVSHVTKEGHPR
jgi:hypothetical protein